MRASGMTESLVVYVFLVLCAMVLSWILLYRSIVRRLNVRHPKKYLAMRATSGVPKNSILIGCFLCCGIFA